MGYLGDNSTHYFIPGIGIYNLNIEEAESVKILYNFLDEIGEIDRLKNLDHLGIVREVIDGARHSRFDYIALIFALIDNWAQKIEEIHASSGEAEGKNLIKCWALLFNIGHLEWTFFTERILLEVLCEEKLHTKLIDSIKDEKIRKKAEKIFKFNDYNHFYQILAYLRFECLYKTHKSKIHEKWFKEYKRMFKKYIVEDFFDKVEKGSIIYSKSLYRTVRNIAFLLLDSFYTPSGLNLSPVLLFDNPELIRSIVFGETEISNTLKFLNRQLYKSVYLNEKVLAIQSLYYKPLKEKLEKLTRKVENLKNGENVCEFIEEIYEKLNIQKIRKDNRKRKSEYVPVMRFEFEGDDLNEQLKEELYKLPLVEINLNLNCYKVVWKTPLNFYLIQYNSNSDKQSSIAVFKKSFDMVKEFLKGIKDKDNGTAYIEHKRDVIERIGKKYIEQALKLFFNSKDVRWEWDHTSFLRSYFNFPDAVIGFADDVIKYYEKNIISKFEEKEKEQKEKKKEHEISKLYSEKITRVRRELYAKSEIIKKLKEGEDLIKEKPDILCITISNLIAYPIKQERSMEQNITTLNSSVDPQEQNKYTGPIMEIDGLILGLTTKEQLFVCLIEAKGDNENATRDMRLKICKNNNIFRGYSISNLRSSVKGLKDNEKNLSIAYLIITDEKIPTSPNP